MALTADHKQWMSVEDYFEHQLTCDGRHDYDDGYLYRVPDEMDIENEMVSTCTFLLYKVLKSQGYQVYSHSLRVAISSEPKFYYPDIFITREPRTAFNRYTKYSPELIVEVSSDETFERNIFQKWLDYTKIPSLQYYLVVCFPDSYVLLYSKDENGSWTEQIFKQPDGVIPLPLLGMDFSLKEIYR